jgi:hypothetical protein
MKTWKRLVPLVVLAAIAGLYLVLRLPGAPRFYDASGPYLGQSPPGAQAERFAPGILPRDLHSAPAFSPDGSLVVWKAMEAPLDRLTYSRQVEGRWRVARPVPLGLPFFDSDDPGFSDDGRTLFFTSWRPHKWTRPLSHKERIWSAERRSARPGGWKRPKPLSNAVNAMDLHWQFSVAENGALYFAAESDLYRAPYVDGQHTTPQRLGPAVNSQEREGTPFVAPDERYLIFSSNRQEQGEGREDLYASYRQADGTWSNAINLGPSVNTPAPELCPRVSPDGRSLFFLSGKSGTYDAYWIDAQLIEQKQSEVLP